MWAVIRLEPIDIDQVTFLWYNTTMIIPISLYIWFFVLKQRQVLVKIKDIFFQNI